MSDNQLRRIERLEESTCIEVTPAAHIVHFVAPSDAGPVVVSAYGPIVSGRPEVKKAMIKREATESEPEFLRRADSAFRAAQAMTI